MNWTDKHTELLLVGAIGFGGAVLGSLFTGAGTLLWKWIERRRQLNASLRTFKRRLQHVRGARPVSGILLELRDFLLSNDELLKREPVREFFDAWLTEDFIDGVHRDLSTSGAGVKDRFAQLARDADRLA